MNPHFWTKSTSILEFSNGDCPSKTSAYGKPNLTSLCQGQLPFSHFAIKCQILLN